MKTMDFSERRQSRSFLYRRGFSFWCSYLIVGFGLAFFYSVLSYQGAKPFSDFAFLLVLGLVMLDLAFALLLRLTAPRRFRLDGDILTIEWSKSLLTVPLDTLSYRRELSWLLSSGKFFRAGTKTFTVFKDLDGYEEFAALCKSRSHD